MWNNQRFIAAGNGGNTLAYSYDGITWYGNGTTIFTNSGKGVAGNPKIGAVIVDSAISLNDGINSNNLTFASDTYIQSGVNAINVSVSANSI